MQATKSLWGEIPTPTNLPDLPNRILKEQGTILTEATSGALIGETSLSNQNKQSFSATLRIKVPSLGGYIFNLLKIEYPIGIYPVVVTDLTNANHKTSCKDVGEYTKKLEQVLSSEKVKSVISALLAQVSANTEMEEN